MQTLSSWNGPPARFCSFAGSSCGKLPVVAERSDPELRAALGERVRARRLELGYGLREFAELAGIANSQLTRIETGQGMPDVSSLHRLAKRLNRSMEWVLTGEDTAELPLDAFVRQLKELRLDKWLAKLKPEDSPTLGETLRVLAHLKEEPALTTTQGSSEPAEGWSAYFQAYRASISNPDPRDRRSRRGTAAGRALEDRQVGGKVATGPILPDDE